MTTQLETPCREWQGTHTEFGYGRKYLPESQTMVTAHRWVVAQIHGWDAIKGKVVRHRCDNPACFRYSHLQIGTQADNIRDMMERGRHVPRRPSAECRKGHPLTTDNRTPTGRCRICWNAYMRDYKAKKATR